MATSIPPEPFITRAKAHIAAKSGVSVEALDEMDIHIIELMLNVSDEEILPSPSDCRGGLPSTVHYPVRNRLNQLRYEAQLKALTGSVELLVE